MWRLFQLLMAACLAAWPQVAPAENAAAERWPWIAVPADVRSAYQALRNTPAFAAVIARIFASEGGDPVPPDGWWWAFTSGNFSWARADLNGDGVPEVILVLSAPGQPCDDDGCLGFVMVEDGGSDNWRIACELKTMGWSWPRRLRRRTLGWHWFSTGELLVGWRRGTPGRSWVDGPVCYRAGAARPPDWGYMRSLSADSELHAFAETESPYAAALRGMTVEDTGRPRGPEDWRRRFDPLLHLRWMTVHLDAAGPGAVALMLASPLLCRDGRCPVAIVSQPTNVAPRTTLCTLDVPWDADVIRLPERDHGIGRLAIGDRLIGWRDAPENPRGVACTVSALPPRG